MQREQLGALKPALDALYPKVAVIVPVFKQGALLAEALHSIEIQRADFGIATILVNDGCPFPETHAACRDWAIAHPERTIYLRKPNGGLSSARNTGIDAVLRRLPSVEAIYFLDSDNRLQPIALARAFAELNAHPEAAWIYPNIDMFGMHDAYDYVGDYSVVRHLFENICEAGSLVRRRVFEAGIRFDESMKSGYEDWDFWLSAVEKGFRGRCLPEFGFEYRRRPESMVAGSHREHHAIRSYMKSKHKRLLRVADLLTEEHVHGPRYAIFLRDKQKFVLCTDATIEARELTVSEVERLLWKGLSEPARANVPAFLVATTSGCLAALKRAHLTAWAFWQLEERLGEPNVTALDFVASSSRNKISFENHGPDSERAKGCRPAMAMMGWHLLEACVKDKTSTWFDSLLSESPLPRLSVTDLALALPAEPSQSTRANALESLQWVIHSLRASQYRTGTIGQWTWRNVSDGRRQPASLAVRQLAELDCPLLPRVAKETRGKDVAFVLPMLVFGGVEKVALSIAREMKERGWNPHLVISDVAEAVLPQSTLNIFDSVSFLNEPPQGNLHSRYLGTAISRWSSLGKDRSVQRAIGLLSGFDVVINAHSLNLNSVMGELRRRGVKTIAHEHVVDLTPLGAPCGHPYLAVAYEHAYDAVICCSRSMRDWLFGMGVPYDKLIVVENAPSFAVTPEERESVLRARAARPSGSPLNVLVLGRLDRQKGLERVQALYSKTKEDGLPVEWRIVGASVLSDAQRLGIPADLLHPPAFTSSEIVEHLKWADVLLLLSSWEGLPLTVLEALPLGVVPICTDVGAVHEAIEDGKSGFLVSTDTAVQEAFNALSRLQSDAEFLSTLATQAAQQGQSRSWSESVRPLLRWLNSMAATTPKQ